MLKTLPKKLVASLTIMAFALSPVLTPLQISANPLPTIISTQTTHNYTNSITRLGGYDRHGTAIAIADYGWKTTTTAVLAPAGDSNMVDALASSSLAKAVDGPILLSNKDSVTAETLSELKKLGVTKVYIVSGTAVISSTVETQLLAEGITSVRLGGYDRFETAVNIAKELQKLKPSKEVAIANGYASADAISIGAIAAAKGIPVLVVNRDTVPSVVSDFLSSSGITKAYVIGGTAVVSDTVKNLLPNAERLSGQDRYDTNREVLKKFEDVIAGGPLFFANGNDSSLVDSLTGAPMAAKVGGAIVLSNKDAVPTLTKTFVNADLAIKTPVILGGTAVMSESAVKELCYVDPTSTTVLSGAIGLGQTGATLHDVTINGSIILGADQQTLKNVTVNGTVFVDPGTAGTATLDNVHAGKIVVLSGADHSVHLVGTTSDNLLLSSYSPDTHVIVETATTLDSVRVQSSGTIEYVTGSSVGALTAQSRQSEQINVHLGGTVTSEVTVGGSVKLTTDVGTTLPSVKVSEESTKGSIKLEGLFNKVSIMDNSSLTLLSGKVDTMDAQGSSSIIVASGAEIKALTSKSDSTTIEGGGVVNGTTTNSQPILVSTTPPVVTPPVSAPSNTSAPDRTPPVLSSAKLLTSFLFASPSVTGVVNQDLHTVAVTGPYGTVVSSLTPVIAISTDATVSPSSAQNFTSPVSYTVTAQNGTTQVYVVTVTVTPNSTVATNLQLAKDAEALLVSTDYVDYTAVTSALALPETNDTQKIAKTAAINDAISALEIKADLADYNKALAIVNQADYTTTSWSAYQLIVNTPTNIVTNSNTQAEIDAATLAIKTAQHSLVHLVVSSDLTAYNAALAQVDQANYSTGSWSDYQSVIDANVVTTSNTQAEVTTATDAITLAQANLEPIAVDYNLQNEKTAESLLVPAAYVDYSAVLTALAMPETNTAEKIAKTTAIHDAISNLVVAPVYADKGALGTKIQQVSDLISTEGYSYTAAYSLIITTAFQHAQDVYNTADASQLEVDNEASALDNVIAEKEIVGQLITGLDGAENALQLGQVESRQASTLESGTITWSSSNPIVATVNATGVVTALWYGTTTISYINPITRTTNSVTITVYDAAGTVSAVYNNVIRVGAPPVNPSSYGSSDAQYSNIYLSSNTSVATVDPETAVVTAVSAGQSNITNKFTEIATGHVLSQGSVTITVLPALSSLASITGLYFTALGVSGSYDTGLHTATATVPYGTNVTALSPSIATSPGATMSPNSDVVQDFTSPVSYTVTAEDGVTTEVWTVNVIVAAKSSAKSIVSYNYTLQGIAGTVNEATHTVNVEFPYGTNSAAIPEPDIVVSPKASIGMLSAVPSESYGAVIMTITLRVTAEDNTFQDYVVTLTILAPPASISSFSLGTPGTEGVINYAAGTVTIHVPYGTDVTSLTPIIEVDPAFTVSPNPSLAQNFSSPVTYTVTMPTAVAKTYTVTVVVDAKVLVLGAPITGIGTVPSVLQIGQITTRTASTTEAGPLTWASSDPSVVTVDASTGVVTALKAGAVFISYSSSLSRNNIYVEVHSGATRIDPSFSTTIRVGGPTVQPDLYSLATLPFTWVYSSSNPSVATIDPTTAEITAIMAGQTDIFQKYIDTSVGVVEYWGNTTITVLPALGAPITGLDTPANVLQLGQTVERTASTTEAGTLAWTSANPLVATVDASTGVVTALTAGTTLISYSNSLSGNVNSMLIRVYGEAAINNISDTACITVGDLAATLVAIPTATLPYTMVYLSSDSSVATINPITAEVTAVSPGFTDITYTYTSTTSGIVVYWGSVRVTVLAAPQ